MCRRTPDIARQGASHIKIHDRTVVRTLTGVVPNNGCGSYEHQQSQEAVAPISTSRSQGKISTWFGKGRQARPSESSGEEKCCGSATSALCVLSISRSTTVVVAAFSLLYFTAFPIDC